MFTPGLSAIATIGRGPTAYLTPYSLGFTHPFHGLPTSLATLVHHELTKSLRSLSSCRSLTAAPQMTRTNRSGVQISVGVSVTYT